MYCNRDKLIPGENQRQILLEYGLERSIRMKKLSIILALILVLNCFSMSAMANYESSKEPAENNTDQVGPISYIFETTECSFPVNPYARVVGYNNITTGGIVKVVQSILACCSLVYDKSEYNPTSIDGIFGNNTYTAIYYFQSDHNIEPDGTVRLTTWISLKGVYDEMRLVLPMSDAELAAMEIG